MLITQVGGPRGQCGILAKNSASAGADSSEGTGLGFPAGSAPSLPIALCQKWPSHRASGSREAVPSPNPVITALSIPEGKRPWAQWQLACQSFLLSPRLGCGTESAKATWGGLATSPRRTCLMVSASSPASPRTDRLRQI